MSSKQKRSADCENGGEVAVDILRQIRSIPISEIDEDLPIRKYYSEESIFELASSLAASGVLQPILVRLLPSGRYGLVAGSRRIRAARKQGMEQLPGIVLEDVDECEALILGLIENLQRENLTPFEEAWVILKLMQDHKMTQTDVSRRIKREGSFIQRRLVLLRMPDEVQEMVGQKQLSLALLNTIAKLPTADEQVRTARHVVAHRLSPAEAREFVHKNYPERTSAPHAARAVQPSTPEKLILRIRSLQTLLLKTKERLNEFTGQARGDLRTTASEVRKAADQIIRAL